jgi:hypothetical protein
MAAWAVAAAALPVLAACGGSSGGGGTSGNQPTSAAPPASSPAPSASSSASQTPTSSPSAADNGSGATGGKLTPPGTHLAFGQQAVVSWDPDDKGKVFKLRVAVESIQKGSIAKDFKDVQLDAKDKGSTPYYVTVKMTALGSNPLHTDQTRPALAIHAMDDRGQEQGHVTFFGTFQRCDDPEAPKPFAAGKSFTACMTYLVPGGGSIKSVTWTDGPHGLNHVSKYYDNPVVWGAR